MMISNRRKSIILVLLILVHQSITAAASFKQEKIFSFEAFYKNNDSLFKFDHPSFINYPALQLTPDTTNDASIALLYNKSGRIMYHRPFRLWLSDEDDMMASFNTTFVVNFFRKSDWDAGHGFAFLIAPNHTVPEASYGQWLGLTNATTDGNEDNHFVAIEFDTEKQYFDPDDNHLGLNINSIKSRSIISLNASNSNITISPDPGQATNYTVWVQYDGMSKLMEVYMVKEDQPKPQQPLLNQTINLKKYLKQDSYFGFAASTGEPQIQLNCVLKWSLDIDVLQQEKDVRWLTIGAGVGVPVVVIMLLCTLVYVLRIKARTRDRIEEGSEFGKLRLPGMPREFKYKDLKKATNKFDESMRLGEGGFGIVYKGVLPHNDRHGDDRRPSEIAVKKFTRDNIKSKDDFMAELTIIHRLRHKHLVPLVGWCYEKGKLLIVYDFMPNGSVDKHLYEPSGQNMLNWERRYKIVVGLASAVHYLHNEYYEKVVHRDLKASNILLDSDFNARLGDFGLARALETNRNSYAELGLGVVQGTRGYVAPECFHTGKASPESDVFGFGAVVLEVVCGRSPGISILHNEHLYTLVDWVWMLHREGCIQEAVDKRLNEDFDDEEAKKLLLLGLACSHPIASERPQTQDILQIVSGALPAPQVSPFRPVFIWPYMGPDISSTDDLISDVTLFAQEGGSTQSVLSQ
ncbi:Pkinase domain-containing protein/Lectin_legB domain-containing protein [Cephalotus follicularis]|uniref:Pkinase domain-containing protein/Lectin_legB domain-containing protein n=1 Tax=Cephalotus follicularis TaxID=3775 RepID=A0A1Q3CX51_CEPFO|nr:Pkinase domain-containing protein/Lectin_legB domain-containing protein [Cephalotus follicularis]